MGTVHQEGDVVTKTLRRNGNSLYLLVGPEMQEYLGLPDEDGVLLKIKFDKGKHGRFIGFGPAARTEKSTASEKPAAPAPARAVAVARAR